MFLDYFISLPRVEILQFLHLQKLEVENDS